MPGMSNRCLFTKTPFMFNFSLMENRKPKRVQTDEGLEFFNKDCKDFMTKHNIKLYFTRSEMKAAIVERFNRTLKEKIWKHFTLNKTNKYIDQ